MATKYVIIDIDNTICDTPYFKSLDDFHKADHFSFNPNDRLLFLLESYITNYKDEFNVVPIFLTARCSSLYFTTYRWLNTYVSSIFKDGTHLLMRPYGNLDLSSRLKLSILSHLKIEPNDVLVWLDDDLPTLNTASHYNIIHPQEFSQFYLNTLNNR